MPWIQMKNGFSLLLLAPEGFDLLLFQENADFLLAIP